MYSLHCLVEFSYVNVNTNDKLSFVFKLINGVYITPYCNNRTEMKGIGTLPMTAFQ